MNKFSTKKIIIDLNECEYRVLKSVLRKSKYLLEDTDDYDKEAYDEEYARMENKYGWEAKYDRRTEFGKWFDKSIKDRSSSSNPDRNWEAGLPNKVMAAKLYNLAKAIDKKYILDSKTFDGQVVEFRVEVRNEKTHYSTRHIKFKIYVGYFEVSSMPALYITSDVMRGAPVEVKNIEDVDSYVEEAIDAYNPTSR